MNDEVRVAAGQEDAAVVASLLMAFRDHMGYAPPEVETVPATVATLMDDAGTVYLLAGSDGFAQLRFRLSAWTGVEDCWLEDVFVRDTARGRGLGRALVQKALEVARARGCKRIELDVQSDNTAARGLYSSLGFSDTPKGAVHTLFMSARLAE
jgi:ribosomal protein S18 acetylase RimI-like enzyme